MKSCAASMRRTPFFRLGSRIAYIFWRSLLLQIEPKDVLMAAHILGGVVLSRGMEDAM